MGVGQVSEWLVDGLLIITFLVALGAVALTASRRRINFAEVSNCTGSAKLDGMMVGVSAEFRAAIGVQLDLSRDALSAYINRQHISRGFSDMQLPVMRGAELPDTEDMDIDRPTEILASLRNSLAGTPSGGIVAQVAALGELIAQSRNASVTAQLYRPEQYGDRLGINLRVGSSSSHFVRHLIWETEQPHRKSSSERIAELIQPAARCAAIELTRWALRRSRPFPFRHQGLRREGLIRNMVGLLMTASANEFEGFATLFQQFAVKEFQAAAILLPQEYQPHYNLADAREAEGQTARGQDRYNHYAAAVGEYYAAVGLANKLAEPERSVVKRKIMVRLTRAQLLSGIPQLAKNAMQWLTEEPLEVERDYHVARLRQPGPAWLVKSGQAGPVLDSLSAESLYNSACIYTIAADVVTFPEYVAKQYAWDHHARRLLGTALVLDANDRYLWKAASNDSDLTRFSKRFEEFKDRLSATLREHRLQEMSIAEILKVVDDTAAVTGWETQVSSPDQMELKRDAFTRRVAYYARAVISRHNHR